MTIALTSPAASDVLRLVRQGFAWWLGELAGMLPPRLTALFGAEAAPVVLVTLGPGGAALWPSDARRQSAAAAGRRGNRVAIALDRSLVFEAALELPRAAEQALPQILQHQIERLVPLPAGETRFDYRCTPGPDDKLLAVRVFVAKHATIDEALGAARAAGLVPRRVVLADWHEPGRPPLLWQADNAADTSRGLRRRLEIAAVLLAAIAYGLYVHRLDLVRDELAARVAAAEPAAQAVEGLARKVAALGADAAFFAARRREPAPLAVIDALTRLVPMDSWVSELVLDRRNVEIGGYSPHATDLVAQIERSKLFRNPRFSSPITLASDGKREHFDLAFETGSGPER
jgi:general secretion pathway protein L